MSERTFLDANLLVYALYQDMPQYPAARAVLERTQGESAALCVSSQVLAEFYAIITNPRRVTAPFSSGEALREVEKICSAPGTIVLPQPVDVIMRWIALLRRHPVTRKRIFDVQLVATMLANGITRIYTLQCQGLPSFPGNRRDRTKGTVGASLPYRLTSPLVALIALLFDLRRS